MLQGLYFVIDSSVKRRNNAQPVTEFSKRDLANSSFFAGLLLLFCALTFYYFAVLRIDYKKTPLPDLGPYPDATEYFAQAKALSKGRWPSIQIGYEKLPSRYPPGYPALMLPSLKILPKTNSVLAPFRTNQTIGLLLLLTVFTFYAYLAMPLTGGFATLLLATLPGFFTFCRSSLSEISSSALIGLAFIFAYLGLTTERRWKIYVSAVCLGLSLNIRIQSLFFAPLLLAMCFFPVRGTRRRWLINCAAVTVVYVLAASPALVLNTIEFHSPLKTGYSFWTPDLSKLPPFFSVRYVPTNLARLWSELGLRRTGFSAANIFGTGTSFVPAFFLLTCVGLFFVRKSAFVLCALLSILSFLASTLVFVFPDIRFYLPIFVLSIAVAVLPMNWAAKNLLVRRRAIATIGIFILFTASCLGYPSQSGYNTPGIGRSQAWDALHFFSRPQAPAWLIAQHRFLKAFGAQPGVVLSDIDPVYLNAFLPDWIVAAPLDGQHHYRHSQIWHYGRPEALALVKRGLDQMYPVYALFVSRKEMIEKKGRLPELDHYQWTVGEEPSSRDAVILKLTPKNK
jgi:hypothetical protein